MYELSASPKRASIALLIGLAAVVGLLYAWWPAGIAAGLIVGVVAVVHIGLRMQAAANADLQVDATPFAPFAVGEADTESSVRADLEHLKTALGDEYPDFARAATLVVSTQYASAARLQRELRVPYARARRLLTDLESQHFVGPATGSTPRQVLLSKDHLPDLERLLAEV